MIESRKLRLVHSRPAANPDLLCDPAVHVPGAGATFSNMATQTLSVAALQEARRRMLAIAGLHVRPVAPGDGPGAA